MAVFYVEERITPAKAAEYLKQNLVNRPLNRALIAKLTSDIVNGRWVTSHQGIAFFEDGTLCDGQHRLMAIIQSGVTVKVMVARKVPKVAGPVIDGGKIRSVVDCARMGGMGWVNKTIAGISRALMSRFESNRSAPFTTSQITEFMQAHKDRLLRAHSYGRGNVKGPGGWALTYAALLCAEVDGVPSETLTRFSRILATGEYEGKSENAAIRFREWGRDRHPAACDAAEIARALMRCVHAFSRGEPLAKLYVPQEFMFETLLDDVAKWVKNNNDISFV